VLDAVQAAAEVGLSRRTDFYWALHAVLVSRVEHHPLFDEAFRLLWREPDALPQGMELLLSPSPGPKVPAPTRRLAEALSRPGPRRAAEQEDREEVDAVLAWSGEERLHTRDFEQMSAEEVREAERAISRLRLPVREIPTRRMRPDPLGDRIDPRAMLRASLRAGTAVIPLRWRRTVPRAPAVITLCDVSGSMARYARMMLRFQHALGQGRPRVHSFTFGTRLTNVTRTLRDRDVDAALGAVGRTVEDWDGGTCIGDCLRAFNLRWSRRLLGQGAIVLLVTDGLDRGDARLLAAEAERLRRSCRRLVWLNPLLRFDGFEPLAEGVRALLPHVDEFRPVHDLASLSGLALALSGRTATRASRRAGGARIPPGPPTGS
jgi:uncharacterized protein with von Willebrand factor type A (vWA) domain